MTNEEIRELERWISEAIEPKPSPVSIPSTDPRPIRSPLEAWSCMWSFETLHRVCNKYTPRPWASDEAANAMLLEMMPKPMLFKTDYWTCRPDYGVAEYAPQDKDRKLAVCLAFKAWKQKESK